MRVEAVNPEGLRRSLTRMRRLAFAVLQELFDESAYQRFLSRTGLQSSRSAYETFIREQERMKERRPKCC